MTRQAGQELSKFTNYLQSFDPSKGPDSERNPRFSRDEIAELYEQGLSMGLSEEAASNAVLKYYNEIKNRGNLLVSPKTEDYAKQLNTTKTDTSVGEEKKATLPNEPKPLTETVDTTPSEKVATGPYEGTYNTGTLNPYSSVSTNNPITNEASGDNSSIDSRVDNSVNQITMDNSDNRRYYGGSNRTFNYSGGKGLSRLYDTPVSAATMGGFYDVDDSPSASASFLDRYIDMNLLHQGDVEKAHKATGNFDYSRSTAAGYDPAVLLDSVRKAGRDAYSNSQSILDKTFGTKPKPELVDDADYEMFNPEPIKLEEDED